MSVGVSKLGKTDLVFVDPGVKINGAYYRNVLLTQQLLPVMCKISGKFLIFQQDGAPAHRARETTAFWNGRHPHSFHQTCGLPTVQTRTHFTTKIWGEMQQRLYQTKVHDVDELKQHLFDVWRGLDQNTIDDTINEWRN